MLDNAQSSPRAASTINSIQQLDPKEPEPEIKASKKSTQSSNLQASFTLFKSFIGTGILALPYAFQTAGLFLSIIITIIISAMLIHCFLLLLETADDRVGRRKISFSMLAAEIIGLKGKYILQIVLIIEQLWVLYWDYSLY